MTPAPGLLEVIDYSPERIQRQQITQWQDLAQLKKPHWAEVRWLRVCGAEAQAVSHIGQLYGLDAMACEDVVHLGQRPKLDAYGQDLVLILRHQYLGQLGAEEQQISLFYHPGLVVSFEEQSSVLWQHLLRRLEQTDSRLRRWDSRYLLYALLDIVVDDGFPLLEHCERNLDTLELHVVSHQDRQFLDEMHQLRRDVVEIRRVRWALRELCDALLREERFSEIGEIRPYLRDVLDHVLLQLDMAESYRESLGALTELHVALMGQRMNEVMKVLTVIATIFIPITFLAGVYGMNFSHMPELRTAWAYPVFWLLCLSIAAGLTLWFRRRGWW